MTFHFKASTCHAEFHENLMIAVFLLLQKTYSSLHLKKLYGEEGLCGWDVEEPNHSCLIWDFLFLGLDVVF